jgi:nucleotide-binding universal stress UspA family protein
VPDLPADHEAVCGPPAGSEERARLDLDAALEVWRNRFTDVPVDTRLLLAAPATAVLRESAGAALTVVGSRARRVVRTSLVGSVSRTVVQQARCPVVVVPIGTADRSGHALRDGRGVGVVTDSASARAARQRRTPWG